MEGGHGSGDEKKEVERKVSCSLWTTSSSENCIEKEQLRCIQFPSILNVSLVRGNVSIGVFSCDQKTNLL